MSRMSDLALELEQMSYAELEQAYLVLKNSQSKDIEDTALQEFYEEELARRENMWNQVTV